MTVALSEIDTSGASLPQSYHAARIALEKCTRVDECQSWADKAAALASYAKQADDDHLMKMATRIRDRAIRRAGELLKQIEPAKGGDRKSSEYQKGGASPLVSRKEAAEQAGLSPDQMKQAIRVANVPAESFEKQVESDNPPTVTKLAEQGKRPVSAGKPVIDLKGRDPNEFNRSMHFVGALEAYEREISQVDIDVILPLLIDRERERARTAIAKIDAVHDRIITRI